MNDVYMDGVRAVRASMFFERALLPILLLLFSLSPEPLAAQGFRGEVGMSASFLETPTLVRDSVPESEVPGEGRLRQLPDGTVVTCTTGEFCRWYRSGPIEPIWVLNQDLRLAIWTGVQGLSLHTALRGRYGTDGFWPRSSQEFDALSAYVRYNHKNFQAKGGRLYLTNGLGFYNFDGASFLWRGFSPLRVKVWGGWGLAPNIDQRVDGSLMQAADVLAPDDGSYVLGAEIGANWGRVLSGNVMYQRVIRTDRLALYSERAAFDLRALLGPVIVDAAAKYDFAYDEVNLGLLRVSTPIAGGFSLSAEARHYTPYFELWTIWGAFSPVGFNEGNGSVLWSSPKAGLTLQAGGGYRDYEETNSGADFVPMKEDGWRVFGRASWASRGWYADGGYRAETGFGAVRYGGDVAFGRAFSSGTYLGLRGSSTQTFSEFRIGEQFLAGGGIDGALAIAGFSLRGSYAIYRVDYDNDPARTDWTQNRANIGLYYAFGTTTTARSYRAGGDQ
ncbi:MAG: hypothetical protein V3W32_03400 [Gemmatimonadota bacterium]